MANRGGSVRPGTMSFGNHAAIFRADAVRRLIEHARTCRRHAEASPDSAGHAGGPDGAPAGLHLVADIAVYLTSNGLPPMAADNGSGVFAAYAEQFYPLKPDPTRPAADDEPVVACRFVPLEQIEPMAEVYDHLFIKLRGDDLEIGGFNA
ncbi:hypothetical protein PC39_07534 [Salinisphaera sp. PC39]|uniref:hypothetical protein n=1 Tax=Salinisphaera sp. PC39 TaxID=1304156 RepID=UPI0033421DBC